MQEEKRDLLGVPIQDRFQDVHSGPYVSMFEKLRDGLDEHYDRRERVTKASRDVTALSKKIIFSLHRQPGVRSQLIRAVSEDVGSHIGEIQRLLKAVERDLQCLNRHRYAGSLRCLEELVEAMSFRHYVCHQELVSFAEMSKMIPADIALTDHDYIYGLMDLFGEMMRFATTNAGRMSTLAGTGQLDGRTLLSDIQQLWSYMETLPNNHSKVYGQKVATMRASVQKVENLGYGLAIRGDEKPGGWVPESKDEEPPSPN